MRKARKKAVSIIVALTFLLGLVFAYAGPAAAASYSEFTGAYKYVTTGEGKEAGYVKVAEAVVDGVYQRVYQWETRNVEEVYVTLTLPSGVTYQSKAPQSKAPTGQNQDTFDTNYFKVVNVEYYEVTSASTSKIEVKLTPGPNDITSIEFKFDKSGESKLNIDSSVSGDVKATVEAIGVSSRGVEWSETATITIARVVAKGVTVSADDPEVIGIGTNRDVATITVEEGVYDALTVGEVVYLKIDTPGVAFNNGSTGFTNSDFVETRFGEVNTLSFDTNDYRLAWFTVPSRSSSLPLPGKIEITPAVDVSPSVSGDIQITVYSNNGKVPTTTVKVATIGTVPVTITDAKYTGGTVYAGHPAAVVGESSSKLAQFKLKATGGTIANNKVVTLELSAGTFDATEPVRINGSPSGVKLYNDKKAAWFETSGSLSEIIISNFNVKVAADASPGDLVVKVGGTAGASGKITIAKIAKPFTVSAASVPELTIKGQPQAAGNIVITEAAKGTIKGDFRIKLPEGITFDSKPTVKVTAGNLDAAAGLLGDDNRVFTVSVNNTSSLASTIEISGIKYNVGRFAFDGDVEVKVLSGNSSGADGWESADKIMATVVNAKVVTPQPPAPPSTKREASFVIGSTTYKVNGKGSTMDVAPYIDAASGRTYLPVRYVAYALGVSEDNIFYSNGVVSLLKDGRAVQMTIGSKALVVNGVTITMDAAPVIKDGRTMLPFRWIATALGASVKWDEATKTVTMVIE